MISEDQVDQALQGVMDPELKRNLVELGMVRDVAMSDGKVQLRPLCPSLNDWQTGLH